MDFSVLDEDPYFSSLLTDPSYSDFSPSPHSSDTDTLSPTLSPFADHGDFGFSAAWTPSFDSQPVSKETVTAPSLPDWSLGAGSLIPSTTSLLQPMTLLQPFPSLDALSPKAAPTTPSKKPRTKRRKVDNEKEVVTATPPPSPPHMPFIGEPRLTLSRDELLTLTSAQYEALVSQIRSQRDLTPAEKRDIKNQRRLIKNRESAHASRQRKKDYVQELEKKLADLAHENEKLARSLTAIQNENTLLRSENEYYKGRMQTGTLIPSVVQRGASFLSEQLQASQSQQQKPRPSTTKAGGVVLMVLLFSFGIMFGNLGFPGANTQLSSSQSSVPEVLPRVYQREEYKQVGNAPLDFLSEEDIPSEVMRDRLRKRMAVNIEASQAEPQVVEVQDEVSGQDLSFPTKLNFDPSFFKANTTYLMCKSVNKLEPSFLVPSDDTSAKKLSFIIPPSSLGGSDTSESDSGLLVVTCEVVDVSMVPIKA